MKIAKLKILLASAVLFMTASTQALQPEVLYAFHEGATGADGAYPQSGLVLGSDGNFYGTTAGVSEGPFHNYPGTVFKATPNGVLTTLVSFNFEHPYELALGPDSNFYGTTERGGNMGTGTVFRVTPNGVLTSLVSFTGIDGVNPAAGLTLGSDGSFYGTTKIGGSTTLFGTVFRVTTIGVLTSLVSFSGPNGEAPNELVLASDSSFYGTTREGGSSDYGTVFQVTTNGLLTTLVSFDGDNGRYPEAGLVLGSDGHFYGTTAHGGSSNYGTVFKVTLNGVLTTLLSFTGTNGAGPGAALVLGSDGNFYGTTGRGGSSAPNPWNGSGTVFKVTPDGVLTSLVSFNGENGAGPSGGLILGPDGYFYGTTTYGGPGGGGTIFRLVVSPRFASVARQPGGSMLLTGAGLPNEGYRLWASADLSLPVASWPLLTSASFDSNGNLSYTDAGAATNNSRFYQLTVP